VRHSGQVVSYLHKVGYDVIPVRPDRMAVKGLPAFARVSDIAGPVDLVVMFRRPDTVPGHIREAAAKGARAVWLPPGTWSRTAEQEAQKHHLVVVKDRCLIDEHRHSAGALGEPGAGHPMKQGVRVSGRRRGAREGLSGSPATGYVAGGGGGRRAGGGVRSVLDEKKMVKLKAHRRRP
jgi:predicted CoA-binding protein